MTYHHVLVALYGMIISMILKSIVVKSASFLVVISMMFSGATVHAHGGVDHGTALEAETHEKLEEAQMQMIIALLQKVIMLLKAQKDVQYIDSVPSAVTDTHTEVTHADDEMEMHHAEHSTSPAVSTDTTEVEKLVIEIEEHNNSTHVHVRYVDKPEDMFFAESPMSDEDGVVEDIMERTGLSEDEIRTAIVYMGM